MTRHTHIPTSQIPLKDALSAANAGVRELPRAETRWLKIRGSLASIPRVYPQLGYSGTPDQVLCDFDELTKFVAPFKKSKAFPANCRFKSFQPLYTWQSNVKTFFDAVSGRTARSKALCSKVDGGAKRLDALAHADNGEPLFAGQELIPLVSFIGYCREDGLDFRDATQRWVVEQIAK